MFTLNPSEFRWFDLANAGRFVDFWSQFYRDRVTVLDRKDPIDYFKELNIEGNLSEENVRRLLRWKDPRHLTHRILSGPDAGRDNRRVERVLESLVTINGFRNNQVTEDEMKNAAAQVFSSGIVFQVFLLHIAQPQSYPIVDQHVLRVFSLHTGQQAQENWRTYHAYREYFGQIARAMGITQERRIRSVRRLKLIDDALMVFGRFLNAYFL